MSMNISGAGWNVWGLLRLITEPCDKLLLAAGRGFGWMFSFPYGNVYAAATLLCRHQEDLEVSQQERPSCVIYNKCLGENVKARNQH